MSTMPALSLRESFRSLMALRRGAHTMFKLAIIYKAIQLDSWFDDRNICWNKSININFRRPGRSGSTKRMVAPFFGKPMVVPKNRQLPRNFATSHPCFCVNLIIWKSIISPYVLISSVTSYHDMIYIYYINNSSSISFSSFKPSMLEFLLNANSFCCQGGGLPKLLHAGSLPGSIHGNPVNTGLWTWTECKVATYAHYKWFCHIYHVKLTVSLMCWVMRRISWALGSTAVGTKDVKSCNLHQSTT